MGKHTLKVSETTQIRSLVMSTKKILADSNSKHIGTDEKIIKFLMHIQNWNNKAQIKFKKYYEWWEQTWLQLAADHNR